MISDLTAISTSDRQSSEPGSPERIRTAVSALRGPRARPLHNGAKSVFDYDDSVVLIMRLGTPGFAIPKVVIMRHTQAVKGSALGYQDSNLD